VTRLAAVLFLIAFAAGCATDPTQGYSATSSFSDEFSTIAVPIVENDTFERGIEFEITDAVIKEIERRTPYRVVDQSRADTILTGRIVRAELNKLSRSRLTGLSEEVVLSVTMDFTWRDRRTNRTLVERRSFTGSGLFLPSTPSAEPLEIGRFAVAQDLARDIVNEMRAAW
jgi:hypothetical protein